MQCRVSWRGLWPSLATFRVTRGTLWPCEKRASCSAWWQLLEQGPESRIPEIAARTLAILAGNDANQTAIRLAGMITVHCTLRLSGCRIWHSSASDFMQTVPSTHEESLAVVLSASLLCLRRHSSPYAAAYRPTQ